MAARSKINASSSPMDVLIVGAGLAGLAAAISCALAGHKVSIFERSAELQEAGAGLQITPNASRLFKLWGIADELEAVAAEPQTITVHRYADGAILAHEPAYADFLRQTYKSPLLDIHRADLQQSLLKRARELGVQITLNARVKDLDIFGNAVVLEDGQIFRADLIIAADGLWSRCRECILGRKDVPAPTGDLAYRIMLHKDRITDPELLDIVQNPALHFWIGPKAHVVGYSVRRGDMYNLVLLVPDDLPDNVARQTGSTSQMRALFKDWDPLLTRFLDCVESVDKWRLMYREPLQSWASTSGRIVMIGDASHAMLPYLAQGANTSMEDGAVLGHLMSGVSKGEQIPAAIEAFQRLRKPRSDAIAQETFKQRWNFHLEDGEEQETRDKLFLDCLGTTLTEEFPSRWTCPRVQPWLFGYDARLAAEEGLAIVRRSFHQSALRPRYGSDAVTFGQI